MALLWRGILVLTLKFAVMVSRLGEGYMKNGPPTIKKGDFFFLCFLEIQLCFLIREIFYEPFPLSQCGVWQEFF